MVAGLLGRESVAKRLGREPNLDLRQFIGFNIRTHNQTSVCVCGCVCVCLYCLWSRGGFDKGEI